MEGMEEKKTQEERELENTGVCSGKGRKRRRERGVGERKETREEKADGEKNRREGVTKGKKGREGGRQRRGEEEKEAGDGQTCAKQHLRRRQEEER